MTDGSKIRDLLLSTLPPDRVRTDPDSLEAVSGDMTEHEPHLPDALAFPTTVEEIQAILKLANEHSIPLTLRVAGTNLGGLTIPLRGGIVLDLSQMKRIIEVNEKDMYAILEPGVTFGDLKTHLDGRNIPLTIAYPLSPPDTSVMCNCLLDGLGNLSLKHGSMADWVAGLEVLLPSGQILRTGSCALTDSWCSRGPLPDLTGLFIGWQGTTGIVTKISVHLWPKPALSRRAFLLAYSMPAAMEFMRELARTGVADDLGGVSWPLGRFLFGIRCLEERDPNEPEFFSYIDISGNSLEELSLKWRVVDKTLARLRERGIEFEPPLDLPSLARLNPAFGKFADFPMSLDFLMNHPGGGLTWVGTYGPTSRWEEGVERGARIMVENSAPPSIVLRPMKGGHFGVMRFITLFDRKNPDDIARVRRINEKLCEMSLEVGFVPYKAPAWMVQKFLSRLDPQFHQTLQAIKCLLDPNRIMNPGRWLL